MIKNYYRSHLSPALSGFALKPISIWFYLIALAMAEILTVYSEAWVGISCFWILLIYSTIQPFFNDNIPNRNLLLSLCLLPLIRIMSVSLPITNLPQVIWYPLIYLPLLVGAGLVMYVTELKPADIGFVRRRIAWQIPLGIACGLVLGVGEYLILRPQPLPSAFTFESVWLPAAVLFLTTGVVEEVIFRGVIQSLALGPMGIAALVYISILFAIMHFGFYSSLDVLFVFAVAMIFAIAVRKTGSIWGVIFAHGTTNIVLFTIGPFILS